MNRGMSGRENHANFSPRLELRFREHWFNGTVKYPMFRQAGLYYHMIRRTLPFLRGRLKGVRGWPAGTAMSWQYVLVFYRHWSNRNLFDSWWTRPNKHRACWLIDVNVNRCWPHHSCWFILMLRPFVEPEQVVEGLVVESTVSQARVVDQYVKAPAPEMGPWDGWDERPVLDVSIVQYSFW